MPSYEICVLNSFGHIPVPSVAAQFESDAEALLFAATLIRAAAPIEIRQQERLVCRSSRLGFGQIIPDIEVDVVPEDLRMVLDVLVVLQSRLTAAEAQARAELDRAASLMARLTATEAALDHARNYRI